MKKPITPHQMNLMTSPIVDVYSALENEILKQITRRLKRRGKADILQWQTDRLGELRLLNKDLEKYLAEATGIAESEIRQAIENNGYKVVEDTDEYMKAAGKETLPIPSIDPLMESFVSQTFREINNFVNETLITTNFGEGTVSRMYRDIITDTTAKFASGIMTFDEAIEDTILQWADKGVPSTFTDRGGHAWSMERYVETVLKSTNARIYNELRTSRMREYGVHTVLMSSKSKSREACSHIQGKVIDTSKERLNPEYPNIYDYGYGTPAGTRGINCYHQWFPFIPGVNTNNQQQFDPSEAVKNEEIEQGRRSIARRIRKTKKKLMVTEELDSTRQEHYRKLLNKQRADMRKYVKQHNLTRNYRFEKVYTPKETLLRG